MTDPWMDGAIPGRSPRTQRARLALLLLIALALPVIIVAVGSRQPVAQSLDMAGADETVLASAPTTVQEWSSVQEWRADRAVTSEEETTSTTEEPTTTAAPTTAAPTTATTAKPTTTSAKPTTTTTQPAPAVQAAPVTTPAPTTTAKPVATAAPTGGATAAEAAFLACVRQRESGGNYAIVSPDGLYMGAYQFYQGTWNSAANIAGRPDLVGLKPNTVAPGDQDAVALAYYRYAGASPWGGHCG